VCAVTVSGMMRCLHLRRNVSWGRHRRERVTIKIAGTPWHPLHRSPPAPLYNSSDWISEAGSPGTTFVLSATALVLLFRRTYCESITYATKRGYGPTMCRSRPGPGGVSVYSESCGGHGAASARAARWCVQPLISNSKTRATEVRMPIHSCTKCRGRCLEIMTGLASGFHLD
jgi:hypothetical protein